MGGIEESPTVVAVQDGHFADPPYGTTESLRGPCLRVGGISRRL